MTRETKKAPKVFWSLTLIFSLIFALSSPTQALDVTMYSRVEKNDIQMLSSFETEAEFTAWQKQGGAAMKPVEEFVFEGKRSALVTLPPLSSIILPAGEFLPSDISRATYFMFNAYSPSFVNRTFEASIEDTSGNKFSKKLSMKPLGFISGIFGIKELSEVIDAKNIKNFTISREDGEDTFDINLDNLYFFLRPADEGIEGKIIREKRGKWEVLTIDDGTPQPEISAEDEERGYLAFRRHYLRRVYPNTVPKTEEVLKSGDILKIKASPGEFEPIALGIYPLKEIQQFTVGADDLIGPGGKIIGGSGKGGNIDVRFVHYAYTSVGPGPLNQCMAVPKDLHKKLWINLQKGETRQCWLTVHIPEDARTGTYTGNITLGPRRGSTSAIPLEVEVLPITLESPPGIDFVMIFEKAFRTIGWLSNYTSTDAIPEDPVALSKGRIIYQDLKNHGMTAASPYCHNRYREKENGEPYLPVAETALEEAKRAGLMGPTACVFTKLLKTEKLNRTSGTYAEYDSKIHPEQAKKIASYLEQKAKEKGWPQPVICAIDEPAHPDRNRIAVELNRAVKEAGGKTHLACSPGSLKNPFPWIDIINYNSFSYFPEEAQKARKMGKKVWLYNNSALIRVNAAQSRFIYGFFGWRAPVDGITTWTYHLDIGTYWRTDVFGERRPNWDAEHGTPVTCREWESIREGIDDRRYIHVLERLIVKARKSGKLEAAASGQNVLDELWSRLHPRLREYNFRDIMTAEMRYDNFLKPEVFDRYRSRIIDEILKLQEVLASS